MTGRSMSIAALCAALLTHAPLRAEDAPARASEVPSPGPVGEATESAPPAALEPIVVIGQHAPYTAGESASATKLGLSLRDTPQSITVVTAERLEDQNLQSLRDVLDNTTGVYSYAYDTERVIFTSRGFFIDSLMVDGVPAAPSASTESADETLDTALYQRIEIVRGATGLMTGAGSPSASVNLVRKHADSRALDVAVNATTGSWDDRRAVLDVSTPLTKDGDVRGRAIGVYQHRESYQDLYENEKKVWYAIVDADLAPTTRLSVGYDFQETMPQGNTWGSFPLFFADGTRTDWDRSVTTATDWSFWNKRRETAFVELRQQLGEKWSLSGSLTHRRNEEDLALFYVYGFPDRQTGEGLEPFAYREKLEINQDAADLYLTGPFRLLGREHELVVGYNGSKLDVDASEYAPGEMAEVGNFFEWDGSYAMPTFGEGAHINDVDTRQHGLYTAGRFVLAERLKLIAGARHNIWKSDYYYVYTGPDPFKHDHRKTTPYAGLVWDVTPTWSAFTSYTYIFNPQHKLAADGHMLDPIDGKSLEVGVKGEHFGGRLNTALTLFDTRQDNVGVPATNPDGSPIWVVGNEGRQQASVAVDGTQTKGFELEASGSPLPRWNLSLGWSRYLLEDGEGEDVKPWIPRTLVRAFTTWSPAGALSPLTIGGGVNWQSDSRVDVFGPVGAVAFEQDAVTLVSLMARWAFTPSFSVQVNGENLADEKYYVLDEYGNLYFGEPANVSASLTYRF